MTLFSLYVPKNDQKNFCSAKMITKLNNAAHGQNLFSNMAFEVKSLATPGI